jgi:hypothetical protein
VHERPRPRPSRQRLDHDLRYIRSIEPRIVSECKLADDALDQLAAGVEVAAFRFG